MGCFVADAPAPTDYGAQLSQTLAAQQANAPAQLASEAQYQPLYSSLALQNLNTLLTGSAGGPQSVTDMLKAGNTGWYDASGKFLSPGVAAAHWNDPQILSQNPDVNFANMNLLERGATYLPGNKPPSAGAKWYVAGQSVPTPRTLQTKSAPGLLQLLSDQASSQRGSDIADVARLGPEARAAMLAANPDQAALLSKLNSQANEGLDAGSNLTPDEQRAMQQASRAAFAARGVGGTNASIADELLRQFNLGQQLLRQRQQFAGTVLGENQAIVGDPFQQILSRTSGAVPLAGQVGQNAGPSLFNPESALAGSINAGNKSYQAMFADPSGLQKASTVAGGVGTGLTAAASLLALL